MAWYSDEQYAMIQDCREKKSTAASAFKQRTHCGKTGGVKLPSDYMSRKEIKAMNGECVTYCMNKPIAWEIFKTWPEEHQKNYILNIREKFKAPSSAIAKAMGVEQHTLGRYIKCLGINRGKEVSAAGRYWHETNDADRFWAWWNGEEVPEVEEVPDLRKPMSWNNFKKLPDGLKTEYITWIRDYFEAPNKHIAEKLFKVSVATLHKVFAEVGLNTGKESSGRGMKQWNKDSFIAWCEQNKKVVEEGPVTKVETPVVDIFDIFKNNESVSESVSESAAVKPVETNNIREDLVEEALMTIKQAASTVEREEAGPIAFAGNQIPVIPKSGSMTFENNYADDVLTTLKTIFRGMRMNITVTWNCE